MAADQETLRAALRIKHDPTLQPLLAWLKDERNVALAALVKGQDDRIMHCGRGAYIAFDRIIDLIETAPAVLDKKTQPGSGRDVL